MNKKLIDIVAQFGSQFSTIAVGVCLTPVAARFLEDPKKELGVWAILLVVTGFGSLFASGSLGSFAIRTKDLGPQRRSSLFLLTLMFSVSAGLVVSAGSRPVCQWMGIGDWTDGLIVMAASFVPTSWQMVSSALLRKEKRFLTIMSLDVTRSILVIACTSYLLISGVGLWSYILVNLAASLLIAFAATCLIGFPGLSFDWDYAKEGVRYCLGMTGFTSINYWSRNLDNVLVGRYFGSEMLGVYANAYRIMFLPTSAINAAFQSLLLPYLAPHQSDREKLLKHFLSSLQTLGLITIPAMTFIWLVRFEIVELYFGRGWEDCAELLTVLMPIGMLQTLLSPLGLCYQIAGKTGTLFKLGLFNTAITTTGFIIGIQYDLTTFVWIYAFVNVILIYPIATVGIGTIGGKFMDWFLAIGPLIAVPFVAFGLHVAAERLVASGSVVDHRVIGALLVVTITTLVVAFKLMPDTLAFARSQFGLREQQKRASADA